MARRAIVLDANILIRAALGQRVRELIMEHAADVSFFAPDVAFDEARQYLYVGATNQGVVGSNPASRARNQALGEQNQVLHVTVGPLWDLAFHSGPSAS